MDLKSIDWIEDTATLRLLDQTKLPESIEYVDLADEVEIAAAIRDMTVRGAPAIGVAAAYGIVAAATLARETDLTMVQSRLDRADEILRNSRPTAVNLFWALDRMQGVTNRIGLREELVSALLDEARAIEGEIIEVNYAISNHAMSLVPDQVTFFHHCNTGSLAAIELGTALGIIRSAHERGKDVMVYLDETRPRLQGAKLSAFELGMYGVKHSVVVDGASAHVMRTRNVDLCVVGCDRVAANGDTANKIGTYNLALAAMDNKVPFYVAAPSSTIDLSTANGDDIEIENREEQEVTEFEGWPIAPKGSSAFNPAFDVTPARLITAIITEFGIAYPPFEESLANFHNNKESAQ